jgi:GT2 family glycosyltransferase
MIRYHTPAGIEASVTRNLVLLQLPSSGRIALDRIMLSLWQKANDHEIEAIISEFNANMPNASLLSPDHIRAALACLAEAGLLYREGAPSESIADPENNHSLVSIVMVCFNSQKWLGNCLASLFSQKYSPFEIIVVDNASQDGSAEWIARNYPEIRLLRLEQSSSLAKALNLGIANARGDYFFLVNPDVELEPNAIAHLVATAQEDPRCAAVAAKLKFLWAPAFLNGLGNYVGALSWGADSALGHLDLGQFDAWDEVPSACFAAALVPAKIWPVVGPIDENFPLYYEDSEWCYRARVLGYTIRAAPLAIAYHAFSGHVPAGDENLLAPGKLRQVVYGRLRFITKLLGPGYLTHFMLGYFVEDCIRCAFALLHGRWSALQAYWQAWNDYNKSLPALREERRRVQAHRLRTDRQLFALQRKIPMPLIRNGLPLLTWDLVCNQYYPWIASGCTRQLPEFADRIVDKDSAPAAAAHQSIWMRAIQIWHIEGRAALLHRLGKFIQWRLALP